MATTDSDVRSWWLVRLRWGSVAGQVVIILAAARLARLELPLASLLALAGAMAATNAGLHLWLQRPGRRIPDGWAGSILAFDMAQLTALLYVTGGASNPFSVFYLVQITAAAATLGARWTWLLTALGVSAYAGLFAMPLQPAGDGGVHAAHDFARHPQTMWVALTLAAALTAFFVTRLAEKLAHRDAELLAMREAAARRERLSATSWSTCGSRAAAQGSTSFVRSKAIDASTVVVVPTGYGSIATAVEAVRLGAAEYLTKPADVDQIVAAFDRSGAANLAVDEPDQVPSLARVEWEHINRVLADCGGNVSKAARLLNIHRRSLQRKLSRFPSSR